MSLSIEKAEKISMGANESSHQFLTFLLGSEEYGVDILRVQEIRGWQTVTPIPNTPDYILGVMNLRGTVIPIVDLRTRFHLKNPGFNDNTVVIVSHIIFEEDNQQRTVGLVADSVSEVYDIAIEDLQNAPDFGCAVDLDYVIGLTNINEKMIILLDVNHLIETEFTTSLTKNQKTLQYN